MAKQRKFQNRIVVGEGYIGIDPKDRETIKLFKDFDGRRPVVHNERFVDALNVDAAKYRLVLERIK